MTNHETARRETVEYFVQCQQPDGTWEQASSTAADLDFATERLAAKRRMRPEFVYRIAQRTTVVVVEPVDAAAVSVPPPAPQAADRRERYAAAIAEGFRAFDADTTSDAYLDAELLDAVVAAADAEQAVTRTAACRDAADAVARLKDLTDASVPEYQRYDFRQRCALGDAESVLRAMATEAQSAAAAPPESCAHCGKNIRLITGTLAAWWVHDPGGHTICFPGQAVSSPRATPKAAGVQDGAAS